jgi:peptidoglycan hydrolase-like protein with peptidoglycan-binding domain
VAPADRRTARIGCAVVFGFVALVGCSTALTSGDGREAVIATTEAPTTTAAPTTTVAPTTTAAPTTTVAPTTTEATTTTTTLPVNIIEVPVLDPPIAALGTSDGAETARLQDRLMELGFWVQGADGDYGLTTRQAVMAFEKYMGFDNPDGKLDEQTAAAISNMDLRPVARANSGTLVEVDKAKQLLFFVVDGRTEFILNTSTGNGEPYEEPDQNTPGEIQRGISLTPSGLHDVNRERPEGWWEGDLGEIYRPKYFVGGVAVHGSNSIPNYPASHGCVRVSVPAMDWIWETGIMPLETPVWVHDGA